MAGSGENLTLTRENMPKLKQERKMADFDRLKNQIEMTVTSEGLRIELLETARAHSSTPGALS
jgi:chemotaxis protein MotB